MMARDRFRDWDAAYVLGALSAEDHREFEAHLAECDECRAEVTELAGVPGLLSKVPASELETPAEPAPQTLMPALLSARRRRRRLRMVVASSLAVAAALALGLALAVPRLVAGPETVDVALSQTVPGPLHADAQLVEHDWGTAVKMTCRYSDAAWTGSAEYSMYVTGPSGKATEISTWSSRPGETVRLSGSTSLRADDIRAVEVRTADGSTVLLRGRP